MTAVREQIAAELSGKVDRYGVVVWVDPERSYADVVDDAIPHKTTIARYAGSWLALRREIEHLLTGTTPPRLVVYVPAPAPEPDPLAELRALGGEYRILLPTLIKRSLGGQLTERRLEELASQCSTVGEVEAALTGGETAADARLLALVTDPSTIGIAEHILSGDLDSKLDENQLWSSARQFLTEAIGGEYETRTGDDLRAAAFRQIVLSTLTDALGTLPAELAGSASETAAAQRRTAIAVVDRLRGPAHDDDSYATLAQAAEDALHLGAVLPWSDALAEVDITPVIDTLAIDKAIQRLTDGDDAAALHLADTRLRRSWWVRSQHETSADRAATWRALHALAELLGAITTGPPDKASFDELLDWYASGGWHVDAAYRRVELIRVTAGLALDELDQLFHDARARYEHWTDTVIRRTTAAASQHVHVSDARLQRTVHERHLKKVSGPTAFVLVDALRYELGQDLAERLTRVAPDVEADYAIATPPTITPVGMAAVLPGAESSFELELGGDDHLSVKVAGTPVRTVRDRVNCLELRHGKVADLDLDWVAQARNTDIKRKLSKASLVLVRSTEIDADGESDQLAASWASFDGTLNILHTAVAKLLHAGVRRVVITADHGFLAVRRLGDERKIDKPPTGAGDLHRRAWIGRGGTSTSATVKLSLADFGIGGDLDLITPRGLGVFFSGGGLQFFHGGLSPQELVIPVITVSSVDGAATPGYEIDLAVAGGQITTGIVAVTVQMRGDLFTRESGVRIQLTQEGRRVARTVGGDGVDFATEVVDATVDTPRVITMQVTSNLVAGSTATLEVLDATTGVRLGDPLEVEVAANVLVEDDL